MFSYIKNFFKSFEAFFTKFSCNFVYYWKSEFLAVSFKIENNVKLDSLI